LVILVYLQNKNKMKARLFFFFIFLAQFLSAQTFTEVIDTPFDNISSGSVNFIDIDNDSDQDVLITGGASGNTRIAKLYINDGGGNFTEMLETTFDGVAQGSAAFSDVDGDNDQDVLITGINTSDILTSKLYLNDGEGNFTEVQNTPFEGVVDSSIAFSDVDGDNDQDVLITGGNGTTSISKLYLNDGLGNFAEMQNTPFLGVQVSSIAFSDVDSDNDQDVLITGGVGNSRVAILYLNDGLGTFTKKLVTPFEAVAYSTVAFSDVDGDSDEDVLIIGANSSFERISKLYLNDGLGNFTKLQNTSFDGASLGSIAFSDVDGDNDQDVLITGRVDSGPPIAKLYHNDGLGNFTEVADTPFKGVVWGTVAFSDVDGDTDQDVFITGSTFTFNRISRLYLNGDISLSSKNLESELNFEFTLYPNPTKATAINIRYDSKENGLANLSIYDMEGRLLKQHQEQIGVGEQNFSINISSLTKGSYIVELNDGLRKGGQMFVVQ